MKTTFAFLSLAGLFSAPVLADVQINGFANLIGGMTLDDDESLYGYDSDFNFDPASVFGLQVRGDVSDKLSATAQLVGRGSEDYDASFEWAYMTYLVSNNTSISAGRLRLPLFKYSASLDVGYSYHWLTPPQAVYDVDFNNVDGARIDYQNFYGDWEYGAQLTAGRVQADTFIGSTPAEIELTNLMAASFNVARDWFSARALVGRAKVVATNEEFDSFLDGLAQFDSIVSGAATAASNLRINDDTGMFYNLAIDIDKYNWFVGAEFTRIDVDESIIPVTDGFYVTAGMRIGKFTPHITYETSEKDTEGREKYIAGLPSTISTGDATIDATWLALSQGAVGAVALQREDFDAVTIGLRYDIELGFAVKTEVTWFSDDIDELNDATLLRVGVNYTF